jgi:hypothetical protein
MVVLCKYLQYGINSLYICLISSDIGFLYASIDYTFVEKIKIYFLWEDL